MNLRSIVSTAASRLATRITVNDVIDVTHQKISFGKIKQNFRIVALSDIHPRTLSFSVEELVSLVNKEDPDIFILAGDVVDRRSTECFVDNFSPIHAKKAKLAVLGNLEYDNRLNVDLLRKRYADAGVTLLINEVVEIDGIKIVGLDDYVHGSPDFGILENVYLNSQPMIWLSHCPKSFDIVSSKYKTPALMISGHTHGGQIAPFGKAIVTPYGSGSYKKGWYKRKKHMLYVMRGIGTSYRFPLRFGVKSEILVLDIGK